LPLDAHFAIGSFIRDALRGGAIQVKGDGTPYRSYLYAADLAVWLWTILFCGHPAHTYNVGSEASMSTAGVAQAVRDRFTPPPLIQIAQAPAPAQPVSRYGPATRKVRTELGLCEDVDLRDGIRRTVLWHQQNRSN
jgi:dTDP-glucose 4,6-dehydratase